MRALCVSVVQGAASIMADVDVLLILLVLVLVSGWYSLRTVVILAGYFKDPILRRFEKYGDDEDIYYPFPGLLFAMSIFALTGATLLSQNFFTDFYLWLPGFLLLGLAALTRDSRDLARRYPSVFQAYPRWLSHLQSYTTRAERRRIAYCWLRLPWRARLTYNSNNRAFFLWADLVIVATVL